VRDGGVLIGVISWLRGKGVKQIREIFVVFALETASGSLGSPGRDDRWASPVGDRKEGSS
jgi:hypothetical protein